MPSGFPEKVIVKVQIPFGKRGRHGGIKKCSKNKALAVSRNFFKKPFLGFNLKNILVEEELKIKQELYLSIAVDRSQKCLSVLFSRQGGMDIEELALKHPQKIQKTCLNINHKIKVTNLPDKISAITQKMAKLAVENDAILVEINPLVLTEKNEFIAADGKITIDDNALFRQPRFQKKDQLIWSKIEQKAHAQNLEYVELDGNIGVIGNGAGLTMASLDILKHFGGCPANFLDIGGGADREKMQRAIAICTAKKNVKSLFINIFGGITHCDQVALGIIEYHKKVGLKIPLAIRLIGTNEALGRKMLEKAGFHVLESIEQAAQTAIQSAKK